MADQAPILKQAFNKLKGHEEGPCVSIIIPTHRISRGSNENQIQLKNAVKQAKASLESNYDNKAVAKILDRLDQIQEEIDFNYLLDGLGYFISNEVEETVHFPFPVEEKVIVDQTFEVRDIVYSANSLIQYNVLLLSENGTRLFHGHGSKIEEAHIENFPKVFIDDYEYPKPSRGNPQSPSMKGAPEKSDIEEKRAKDFLRDVDKNIAHHLLDQAPIFLIGGRQLMNYYHEITNLNEQIFANINGNYDHYAPHHLYDLIEPELNKYLEKERAKVLDQLKESVGSGKVEWGIGEVWRAAKEGKGATLLVERNYKMPAYLEPDDEMTLHFSNDGRQDLIKLNDAIDDTIEEVIDKNGRVIFINNDGLEDFDHIAMLLRYNERF